MIEFFISTDFISNNLSRKAHELLRSGYLRDKFKRIAHLLIGFADFAFGQLNHSTLDLFVGNGVEKVGDGVELSPFLVIRADHTCLGAQGVSVVTNISSRALV